ncbi:MAG: hypothetical protein LBB84_07065 [Tannerellaceae bacterium]|jgi:hypothetical protein|nr:hypothetical protein [Tannerellaceae bacterium]
MEHIHIARLTFTVGLWVATSGVVAQHSPAAEWLAAQVNEYSSKLYVYNDYGDSRNAFTQRGVMMYGNIAEPQMNEAYPEPFSGITSIRLDVPLGFDCWSGYYFGNGVTTANGTPVFDWGDNRAGMDLRGATKLVFRARAEAGQTAKVNFFIGGNGSGKPYNDSGRKETGYVTLTSDWQKYEINLSGVNLSYISGGFGWVTNHTNNPGKDHIVFLLDEIYYEFASPRPEAVFPASYKAVPLGWDGYFINSFAYSYDLAMTVLALAYAGKDEQACKVADGLLFALSHDRKFTPSQRGIRNGYAAGHPASFSGWTSASGKSPYAKLPGFFDIDSQTWWEDYYSDSYSTGNNAWGVLAFLEVWRRAGKTEYLQAACTLADYIHSLKDEANGGFKGGWEGFDDNQQKTGYISTEHCIDIYSAFMQLAGELEKNATPQGGKNAEFYRQDAAHARAFVMRMYDPAQGLFYTGTKPDGSTINRDVYPLDVNTWGLLTFYNDPAVDVPKILSTIESRFAVNGMYDFDDSKDGVWWEGSLQKIIAEKVTGNTAKYLSQLAIANAAAEADGSITAADRDGVTTGIWLEGVGADGKPQGNEWKYNKRIHTGATAWLALAQLGVNPLDPRRSETGLAGPTVTPARSFVQDGRLYITGLAQRTPVKVYSITGMEILRSESSDTFSFRLPAHGAYIVSAGTENWKIIY